MTREDVFAGVQQCLADALDIPIQRIHPEDRLVDDLGADSLDLLDLTFRLEQRFKIHIRMNGLDFERRAKVRFGDQPWQVDGAYTPAAVAELRAAMPEVPPEELHEGLTSHELFRAVRVVTIMNLISTSLEDLSKQASIHPPTTLPNGGA